MKPFWTRSESAGDGGSNDTKTWHIKTLVDDISGPKPEFGWRSVVQLFGSIASIVALASAGLGLGLISEEIWSTVVVVWLIGMVSFLLWTSYRIKKEYERRARYALLTEPLHKVQHSIRDAEAEMLLSRPVRTDAAVTHLRDALSHTARAFTMATAAPFRACIKDVAVPEDGGEGGLAELQAKTFCRDTYSPRDDVVERHPVTDSTAFESLIVGPDESQSWWWSNDLHELDYYKNPSIPAGGSAKALQYRCTAVWPIRKRSDGATGEDDLRGFLCIDSPVEGVIEPKHDFHLGAAIADSLYGPMVLMGLHADGKRSPRPRHLDLTEQTAPRQAEALPSGAEGSEGGTTE